MKLALITAIIIAFCMVVLFAIVMTVKTKEQYRHYKRKGGKMEYRDWLKYMYND